MNVDTQQPADSPLSEELAGTIVLMVLGAACVSLSVPIAVRVDYLGAALLGIVFGQCVFLAFWAMLAPQRLSMRFAVVLAGALLIWAAFLAGMEIIGMESGEVGRFAQTFFILPLVAMAVEGPIWILKWALGCRMVLWSNVALDDSAVEAHLDSASARRQFGLSQMIMATALIALSLGLATTFVRVADQLGPRPWLGLSIIVGGIFLASAAAAIPCICAALMIRNPAIGIVALLIQTPLVSLGVSQIAALLRVPWPLCWFFDVHLAFFLMTLMVLGTCFAGMQILRFSGYELMWPTRMRRWAAALGNSTVNSSLSTVDSAL